MKKILPLLLVLLFAHPSWAEEQGMSSIDATSVGQAMQTNQQEKSTLKQAITLQKKKLEAERVKKQIQAEMTLQGIKKQENSQPGPMADEMLDLSSKQVTSNVWTDYTREHLDQIYMQMVEGVSHILDVGTGQLLNPYLQGRIRGLAELYETYVIYFCVPKTKNAPISGNGAVCGSARADAGLTRGETFIDFFLGNRTWPNETVSDVMQLARAFFGYVPDTDDMTAFNGDRSFYVQKQATIARSAVDMAIIDYLAAQRAPTSTATKGILEVLLNNLSASGKVSSLNYTQVCAQKNRSDEENYACSFTSYPEGEDLQNRRVSKAAINHIMGQFYMSPAFYTEVNSRQYNIMGIRRLKTILLAQRVAQEYERLQLMKMMVAKQAINLSNGS